MKKLPPEIAKWIDDQLPFIMRGFKAAMRKKMRAAALASLQRSAGTDKKPVQRKRGRPAVQGEP